MFSYNLYVVLVGDIGIGEADLSQTWTASLGFDYHLGLYIQYFFVLSILQNVYGILGHVLVNRMVLFFIVC